MGEAKRRKKLDSANYGQVFSLKTKEQKIQHAKKIINDFQEKFEQEFLILASAKFLPDNYYSIVSNISSWFQKRFANYTAPDCGFIALTLLYSSLEFNINAPISSIFSVCLIDVLYPYLSPEDQTLVKKSKEDILVSLVQEAVDFDDEAKDSDYPLVLLGVKKTN